jgi:type IV pilus assembly protein PilB
MNETAKSEITLKKLSSALSEQDSTSTSLNELRQKLGLASEQDLARTLSSLLHIPYLELDEEYQLDRDLSSLIPAQLARRYGLIPYATEGKHSLTIVMINPLNVDAIDAIRTLTKLEIHKAVAPESAVKKIIENCYREEAYLEQSIQDIVELEEETSVEVIDGHMEIDQLRILANDAPVVRFVNLLLMEAVRDRASDIHFEPGERDVTIRIRIDGVLREVTPPPKSLYPAIVTRVKILSEMDIAEHRLPLDGRFKFKVYGRVIDVRVSTIPLAHGEKIVLRLLDRASLIVNMEDVGFDSGMLSDFQETLKLPNGIILLTGPTGSGKTTTLYGALNHIKNSEKNLQTVEDPIEYLIDGINQMQIKPKIGLDFANCLRSILRQDPDIIMIGEIRDMETAQIAIRSSLTGHLVLSSLHTNDAPSAFNRLHDIGIPPYLIAATMRLVIAQRLVRVLCSECKTTHQEDPAHIELISKYCSDAKKWNYYHGVGCKNCNQRGFRGRTAIFEYLKVTQAIRNLITEETNQSGLRDAAIKLGMEPLSQNGFMKVKQGITTVDEVLHVAQDV